MPFQSHVSPMLTRRSVVSPGVFGSKTLRTLHLRILSQPCNSLPSRNKLLGVRYASTASPERIAVLGGGIAGLSSAYFTAKEFPQSKITLYESGPEVGGWIKSRRINVGEEGSILFELGPRSLRNSTVTASLIQELDIVDDVLYTLRTDPGAKNRFIFFPDRLNRLPSEMPTLSSLFALYRSGILNGAFSFIKEPMVPRRSSGLVDETVGSFLARRVDKQLANNIISAGIHGVYAGDIWNLSAKTLLSLAWQLEGRYGSVVGGFFRMHTEEEGKKQCTLAHPHDVEMARIMNEEIELDEEFARKLKGAAMFTFRDGLRTLVAALTKRLEEMGVEIKTNTSVQSFKPSAGKKGVEIVAGPSSSIAAETFDLAISTLRNPTLTPYVTVQTVNLYFRTPPSDLLPVQGFGYLIPQSIPFEQNPERALGVIFDSTAIRGQDTANGTKLTVMIGGHWWDGWEHYPSQEEGLDMARAVLKRHLGIEEEPVTSIVNLSRECIPQYTVGYEDRLREFAEDISKEFKGRLRVVGNQFNGVGVNDCITGAWKIARGLRGDGWTGDSAGLERVCDQRPWMKVEASEMVWSGRGGDESAARGGRGGVGGGV